MERVPVARSGKGRARVTGAALSVCLLGIFLASCSKPPSAEQDRARAAVERAKSAEAETYAPSEYRAASDTLGMADDEVAAQSSKFALSRSYSRAKSLYLSAERAGEAAAREAGAAKQQAHQDALSTLAQLQDRIGEVQSMFQGSKGQAMLRAKKTGAAMRDLQDEMKEIGSTIANMESALAEGKYKQASEMAHSALEHAQIVRDEVSEALATGIVPSRGEK